MLFERSVESCEACSGSFPQKYDHLNAFTEVSFRHAHTLTNGQISAHGVRFWILLRFSQNSCHTLECLSYDIKVRRALESHDLSASNGGYNLKFRHFEGDTAAFEIAG